MSMKYARMWKGELSRPSLVLRTGALSQNVNDALVGIMGLKKTGSASVEIALSRRGILIPRLLRARSALGTFVCVAVPDSLRHRTCQSCGSFPFASGRCDDKNKSLID